MFRSTQNTEYKVQVPMTCTEDWRIAAGASAAAVAALLAAIVATVAARALPLQHMFGDVFG